MHRLHELLPDVVDDIIAFLGCHPCLRTHESVTLGQGLEHGVGVCAELQFTGPEGSGHRQRRFFAIAAVAVDAEILVYDLAPVEAGLVKSLQDSRVVDGVGFLLIVLS